MEAVTGKAIVTSMMRLATEMSSWNKAYATEDKVAKRTEELGLTPHQAQMLGFLYSNPELDTVSALSARLHVSKGSLSLMLSKLEAGGFVQKKAVHVDELLTLSSFSVLLQLSPMILVSSA